MHSKCKNSGNPKRRNIPNTVRKKYSIETKNNTKCLTDLTNFSIVPRVTPKTGLFLVLDLNAKRVHTTLYLLQFLYMYSSRLNLKFSSYSTHFMESLVFDNQDKFVSCHYFLFYFPLFFVQYPLVSIH